MVFPFSTISFSVFVHGFQCFLMFVNGCSMRFNGFSTVVQWCSMFFNGVSVMFQWLVDGFIVFQWCLMAFDVFSMWLLNALSMVFQRFFNDLGVFHKGFAIALDENGWTHIDTNGLPIYDQRYQFVEPFYNGWAIVKDFDGNTFHLSENGESRLI